MSAENRDSHGVFRLAELDTYRIGWRLRRIPGDRRRKPTFRRPWQCEVAWSACTCGAVRALTERGARRRMARAHNRAAAAGRCAEASMRVLRPMTGTAYPCPLCGNDLGAQPVICGVRVSLSAPDGRCQDMPHCEVTFGPAGTQW